MPGFLTCAACWAFRTYTISAVRRLISRSCWRNTPQCTTPASPTGTSFKQLPTSRYGGEGIHDTQYKSDAPPLCDGRIRFVRGNYPEAELGIAPNNIAIASYTFTMCRDEDSIKNIAAALVRDFDRFLFNVDVGCLETWKQLDWHGTQFFPIGPQWFVFGTKIPSDVEKIKAAYPFEDGHFETGIDDAMSHWQCKECSGAISRAGREYSVYADWS